MLFIYKINQVSHNSLYLTRKLNKNYEAEDNQLFVERSLTEATFFIYVFYGKSHFELIKFNPNNNLERKTNSKNELFLPISYSHQLSYYNEKKVYLEVFPVYDTEGHKQNRSVVYEFHCQNTGLLIERIKNIKNLYEDYTNGHATISLLDYFAGYVNSFNAYQVHSQDNKNTLNWSISKDDESKYMLEPVNKHQYVLYSFEYKNKYLIVFYREEYLMQIYLLEDLAISQSQHNYTEKFLN